MRFFQRGVLEVAGEAEQTARGIVELREEARRRLHMSGKSANAVALLDHLFLRPIVDVNETKDSLGVSYPTANNMVRDLVQLGLLEEITGGRRHRMFRFAPYLALFEEVTDARTVATG